jgi:hypothetical protein
MILFILDGSLINLCDIPDFAVEKAAAVACKVNVEKRDKREKSSCLLRHLDYSAVECCVLVAAFGLRPTQQTLDLFPFFDH